MLLLLFVVEVVPFVFNVAVIFVVGDVVNVGIVVTVAVVDTVVKDEVPVDADTTAGTTITEDDNDVCCF